MRIESFSLDLAEPLATAAGTIETRDGFIVSYRHRGETGIGEATPLPGWTETAEECRNALERAAQTAEEAASERDGAGHGPALLELDAAEVPAARHGFGTALLDADARADGLTLYEWFDAPVGTVRSVPVNAILGDAPPDETVAAAEEAIESGFDCLKIKIGSRPVPEDLERVRAVRGAVGEDVTIRADANAAYDRETAAKAIEGLATAGVAYVEQPLPADDLDGHRELQGRGVDIALDESLIEHMAQEIIDAEAADVLILKPMVVGGPGNAHTLAMRARDHGIEPVVTTTIDGVVARAAAVHVAAAIPDVRPCGLATADRLAGDLGPDPCSVDDGRITVPQKPGLGVEVDRE
ncbi:MAG: o-succinylbenzoate synthase [Halapricum sp.]